MAKDKISGKKPGNKLQISISSEPAKAVQTTTQSQVQKVKSIAQVQNTQSQVTKQSKKPVINQKQKDSTSVDKNTELLKSIDAQLKSLNTNIVKIVNTGTTKVDKPGDFSKPFENVFGSNFQKGLNDALISLIDSSHFRTKMKQMYQASLPQKLYPTDSSEKIQSQKAAIDSTTTNNSYSVQNSQKAVNTEQYLKTIGDKVKQINENLMNVTNIVNNAETQGAINNIKVQDSSISKSTELNTNTSNSEINDVNSKLLQIKAQKDQAAQRQAAQIQSAQEEAKKRSQIVNQQESRSANNQVQKQNQKVQAASEDQQKVEQNTMQSILQKSEDLQESIDKNIESINEVFAQRIKDKQQYKAQKQKKQSFFTNLFKRKTGSQKKSLQGQLVKDSKTPEMNIRAQGQPASISTKVKTNLITIGRTFRRFITT